MKHGSLQFEVTQHTKNLWACFFSSKSNRQLHSTLSSAHIMQWRSWRCCQKLHLQLVALFVTQTSLRFRSLKTRPAKPQNEAPTGVHLRCLEEIKTYSLARLLIRRLRLCRVGFISEKTIAQHKLPSSNEGNQARPGSGEFATKSSSHELWNETVNDDKICASTSISS